MEATADTHLRESRVGDGNLLRGAFVYGPNASGKSNLIEGFDWMRSFVLRSASGDLERDDISIPRFQLREDKREGVCEMECEFLVEDRRYRYGFAVDGERVREEWAYRGRARLFSRKNGEIALNARQFPEGKGLEMRTRDEALFLAVCATWNGTIAGEMVDWFRAALVFSGLSDNENFNLTASCLENPELKRWILTMSQMADFSIEDFSTEERERPRAIGQVKVAAKLPKNSRPSLRLKRWRPKKIKTTRPVFGPDGEVTGSTEFDLDSDESKGTQRFVTLVAPLLGATLSGRVVFIDEFEARLHPKLTREIVKFWFTSGLGKTGAQLIAATHDTGLMSPDLLRRDQIWFTEKDEQGASALYSLAEFSSDRVRPTTQFERQYLQGIFGALPRLALEKAGAVYGADHGQEK